MSEIELMLLGDYFMLLQSFVADNQREIDSYKDKK
jgi:hypothetical protein